MKYENKDEVKKVNKNDKKNDIGETLKQVPEKIKKESKRSY
jgi:hypothetical protein